MSKILMMRIFTKIMFYLPKFESYLIIDSDNIPFFKSIGIYYKNEHIGVFYLDEIGNTYKLEVVLDKNLTKYNQVVSGLNALTFH